MEFAVDLDARQLACPLPILRAKKTLSQMTGGQVIRITATDRGATKDFEEFWRLTGNELLSSVEQGGEFVFLIRRRQK
ncbi:MAG: sulfurtransferase TusA family protein [Gallionella sp.]|nr:sulfurtransferase TusA family protein [Gallionella sp.]